NLLQGYRSEPHDLYDDLFAGFTPPDMPVDMGLLNAKKSVLDVVLADARNLKKRLGKADQARLDQHMDHIDSIEKQLAGIPASACTVPADPGGRPPDGQGLSEPLEEVNKAMSDLIAYAFACDLARSFRLYFTYVQGATVFTQCGTTTPH